MCVLLIILGTVASWFIAWIFTYGVACAIGEIIPYKKAGEDNEVS